MKRALAISLLWLLCGSMQLFAAFSEFYCDASVGANINAGDNTTNGVVTSTNGAWSTVTNVFTATSGTPFSGVSVGDFASLYADGATLSAYVARVTAVGGGGLTLTLSSTAKSGTAPTTAATGISCTTGGAWKGPNAAVNFPFNFIASTQTDSAGDYPRVNFKNNTTYSITAAVTHSLAGPVQFEGYTSTAGDGGRAIIDGGTSGTSYVILTLSTGGTICLKSLIFQNNGATGTSDGVSMSATKCCIFSCVVNNVRGNGLSLNSTLLFADECEAYACNQSNSANDGGIAVGNSPTAITNTISHDNSGNNNNGFYFSVGGVQLIRCIADTNGKNGILANTNGSFTALACDFYNNTTNGIDFTNGNSGNYILKNCNFLKNGGWGITSSGASTRIGAIVNCGFGVGTQANSSGDINTNIGAIATVGKVTYASGVTPWVDPANGDFRVNLAAAKGAGRGVFTETQASYAGTIGYPDIGAAQHQDSGTTATTGFTFAQ